MVEAYERLEREFGEWMGYRPEQMVACSTGSAALHLACEVAVARQRGQVFTVPDFSMIACARAVSLAGRVPKFSDCNLSLRTATQTVPKDTTALMIVHVYGRVNEMHAVHFLFDDSFIIEDMAEAHGIKPHPKTHAACWSFYKNKIVAGEEGGMVAFLDADDAAYARRMRSHGFTDAHDFQHHPRGMNYRLSNIHAELILRSMAYYPENAEDRQKLVDVYDGAIPSKWMMPPRNANWVYDVRIPDLTKPQQDKIVKSLNEQGVAARHGFYPLSRQNEYIGYQDGNQNPTALRMSREVLYLPLNPGMSGRQVLTNVESLKNAVESARK